MMFWRVWGCLFVGYNMSSYTYRGQLLYYVVRGDDVFYLSRLVRLVGGGHVFCDPILADVGEFFNVYRFGSLGGDFYLIGGLTYFYSRHDGLFVVCELPDDVRKFVGSFVCKL